jgi:hypothetical protein
VFTVSADHASVESVGVLGRGEHGDLRGALDHVAVGDHDPVGTNDEAGADTLAGGTGRGEHVGGDVHDGGQGLGGDRGDRFVRRREGGAERRSGRRGRLAARLDRAGAGDQGEDDHAEGRGTTDPHAEMPP